MMECLVRFEQPTVADEANTWFLCREERLHQQTDVIDAEGASRFWTIG